MPPVGFEPTVSAGERPQAYFLDRAVTGTGTQEMYANKIFFSHAVANEIMGKRDYSSCIEINLNFYGKMENVHNCLSYALKMRLKFRLSEVS